MKIKFRDLAVGDSFDFVNDKEPTFTSYFATCTKTGTRTYVSDDGHKHRVGSINARVYHVNRGVGLLAALSGE